MPYMSVDYMSEALQEARAAFDRGEIPVGAVIVDSASGKVIASAGNETEELKDPTAHAEMRAIQDACLVKGAARLPDCDLYVTLEPCPMCASAIALARLRRVYFGAYDPKGGGIDHGPKIFQQPTCHHQPEVYGGISEKDCAGILKDFFKDKR
jgi:tRNA(Arg) A34 adenosine deaminase TadA